MVWVLEDISIRRPPPLVKMIDKYFIKILVEINKRQYEKNKEEWGIPRKCYDVTKNDLQRSYTTLLKLKKNK